MRKGSILYHWAWALMGSGGGGVAIDYICIYEYIVNGSSMYHLDQVLTVSDISKGNLKTNKYSVTESMVMEL
jgi:hypothetical protein